MSNLMIDKLKHIDNSRKDLQSILETKGVNLTGSNKSLDSLISNVGQLSLINEVNSDTWEGVTEQDDPGVYWKGDEDWGSLIDIDAIMEADTNEYTGKIFYLIRCSDNTVLNDAPNGYTNRAIVGLQAFRFSDSGSDELSTTTAHTWDSTKDIIAPNGERFRWIIGYTNSTTAVTLWQSRYFRPEAVVYWSGTFRGICFEDAAPASNTEDTYYHYYNGTTYSYFTTFSITNYHVDYLRCTAPRYFEVKNGVETQFITGDLDQRYGGSVFNNRTKTVIIDGTCVVEFVKSTMYTCSYFRSTKPGYEKALHMSGSAIDEVSNSYYYADVSGCKRKFWCNVHNAYLRLYGNMKEGTACYFGQLINTNVLCDDIGSLNENGVSCSINSNFECKRILGTVGNYAFREFSGHIKFDSIARGIGKYAFLNCKYMPTEVIVRKTEGYTGTHSLETGAFEGTNVEKIDMRDSAITSVNGGYNVDDLSNSYILCSPFSGATKLKIIHFPKNMTAIGSRLCQRLQGVTTITLPENLVSIGEYAFSDCDSLESITIPETIQSIGQYAFNNCTNLKTADINSITLTSIPTRMFTGCTSLMKVTLPPKCASISDGAFSYCASLENVTLPNTVNYIGEYAFEYCERLKSIRHIDPSVGAITNMGQYAFQGCRSLTDLFHLDAIIGYSSTSFYYMYFMECDSMTFVVLSVKPTNANDGRYANHFYRNTNAKILVPEDYAYTGTLFLGGANWCIRNFLDFIQSIPDRTGGTATKFSLGNDFDYTYFLQSNTASGAAFTVYSIYKNYYVKEIDGILEYSTTQEDDTWILVSDYVAAKNCTLS